MVQNIQHHLTRVVDAMTRDRLVPFLGADINYWSLAIII